MAGDIPEQLHLVESFANSVDVDTAQDDLDSPARFGRWLAAHGFPGVEPGDHELALAVGMRDALRDELIAHHEQLASGEARARLDGYAEQIPLRASFGGRAGHSGAGRAGCDRDARGRPGRDGAGGARRRLAPAQDLPGGDLPAGVLRQVQEPVEDVVLDAGVRQPQQDPHLSGPATRAAAAAGAATAAAYAACTAAAADRSRRSASVVAPTPAGAAGSGRASPSPARRWPSPVLRLRRWPGSPALI